MIRLAVRVRREHAELVLAELLELAPAGVEELPERAGVVEFAVYGARGELPALPDLEAAAGDALVEISTSEVADDWSERWRAFHQPVFIEPPHARDGGSVAGAVAVPALGIRPPWVGAEVWAPSTPREIVIDPARAFGTGSHATTRLCLELLLELAARDPARGSVLDVGTGSGVLAIAAALLGFSPVVALDNERESVDAARTNASVNGVEIDVRLFDLRKEAPPLPAGDPSVHASGIVLANLLASLLQELAESLHAAPAHLIAGGLLHEQVDDVAREFERRLGLRERARGARGEWSALWLSA